MTIALGDPAPGFALRSQHGETVSLADFIGRRLVLVLYPYAFSGVCGGELAEIAANLSWLANESTQVVGLSCDPMYALRAYADRDGLAFPLLSDFWPHGEVCRAYGAFDDERGCPRRATFIVDRAGIVRWQVCNPIGEARDLAAYRVALDALG
jgi:peroxiredoxin